MKCSVKGCSGTYEATVIAYTVRRNAEVFVFNNVPAEVCDLCGDTLLAPETIRRLEALMASGRPADRFAPLYDYA